MATLTTTKKHTNMRANDRTKFTVWLVENKATLNGLTFKAILDRATAELGMTFPATPLAALRMVKAVGIVTLRKHGTGHHAITKKSLMAKIDTITVALQEQTQITANLTGVCEGQQAATKQLELIVCDLSDRIARLERPATTVGTPTFPTPHVTCVTPAGPAVIHYNGNLEDERMGK